MHNVYINLTLIVVGGIVLLYRVACYRQYMNAKDEAEVDSLGFAHYFLGVVATILLAVGILNILGER